MLIAEEPRLTKIYPPDGQLLKWVGNKHKFVYQMSEYFPSSFNCYFEPFLGSGSVLASLSPINGFASDIFEPLIEIWENLKANPELLIKWYSDRRNRLINEDKFSVYNNIKDTFNKKSSGADFLYLSRSCWGGVIRFRKADGFMSTPSGYHTPMKIDMFSNIVHEWHKRVVGTVFKCCDYKTSFELAKKGDFIYCDPPYKHCQGILYGSHTFRLEELFECISYAKSKGVSVAMSLDGAIKSGVKQKMIEIPPRLFERQVNVNNRFSMLLRFKKNGQKLTHERDSELLYLTY